MKTQIKLEIQAQPDDQSCGPSCLYSLYRYYGDESIPLRQVISEIHKLDSGGTLAEILAVHALKRGFRATLYSYHLQMYDPTWFASDGALHNAEDVIERLDQQLREKSSDRRLKAATRACREFLQLGGVLKMKDLDASLLREYIVRGVPIITGLSSTFLYRTARELGPEPVDDDIRGEPQGHFVMLVGYDSVSREVLVADPLDNNPPFHTAKYRLGVERLVNAILLGILTYDANLLVIEPPEGVAVPAPSAVAADGARSAKARRKARRTRR